MSRKSVSDKGKREEIAQVALELFLKNGYEGTSVRSIMKQAGGEVGLFYYYFKNKDDVFDVVLDLFFARYDADFAAIVAHGRRNPCRLMQDFFEYMERETVLFREKYAEKMHRTMRWAIREHTLAIIEPYLEEIVAIQSAYYGVRPALEPAVAAMYLTHGVGSCILHEDHDRYGAHRAEVKRGTSLIMGMPPEEQELRTPYLAVNADVPGCVALAVALRESFPGWEETEFRAHLEEAVTRGEAWLYRDGGTVAALLLYSGERCELDYLAVRPERRGRGLATRLVETAAACFPPGTQLSVTTYREDDARGEAAQKFYTALGFTAGEQTETFGYPCQKRTLTVPEGTPVSQSKTKV